MMWCSLTCVCSVRHGIGWPLVVLEGRSRQAEKDDVILEKHQRLRWCTNLGMQAGGVAQHGPESLEWAGVGRCAVMHSRPATCTHTHVVDTVVTISTSLIPNDAAADCPAGMLVL